MKKKISVDLWGTIYKSSPEFRENSLELIKSESDSWFTLPELLKIKKNVKHNINSFTEKTGIKTEILFAKNTFFYYPTKQPFEMYILSISPNFKYDFGETYRDGFYMLAGPKLAFITGVKSEGEDVKDSFETFNLGAQLGFGWRLLKFFDIQTKLDYELTPFFKLNNGNKSNFFGAVISANIDLSRVLSNN